MSSPSTTVRPASAPAGDLTRGHKKKARTRRQLLDAALEVLAAQGEGFAIADIAARAGVSHGTVYNYFADRDALMAALVAEVVGAFAEQAAQEVDDPDPARRFARITARALAAAGEAPELVRVALRLEAVQRELVSSGPFDRLRSDLADGHALGRFVDPPDDATLDVVVGALLLAARRGIDGDADLAHRRSVVRHLLRSLGVDSAEASGLADEAVGTAR